MDQTLRPANAAQLWRDRPKPSDKWHLNEVVITIQGECPWLWRGRKLKGSPGPRRAKKLQFVRNFFL